MINVGNNPIEMLSTYQLFSLGIMLLYFLPLLLAVYRYCKLADMPRLQVVVRIVLIFLVIWLSVMILFTVLEIIKLFPFFV